MKLTKETLKRIIKEELEETLSENRNTAVFKIEAEPLGFGAPPKIEISHDDKTFGSAEQFVEAYPESAGRIKSLRTKIIEMVRDSKGEMGSVQNVEMRKKVVENVVQSIVKYDLYASDYKIVYVKPRG
jgi:hypothetical protein